MPGNPLTDPNWAGDLADTVERVVGTVRERATAPVVKITRGVVFGLLAGVLGIAALTLALIMLTRALQALLDLAVTPPRAAVYLSYFIIGGILSLAGLLLLRKRQAP